MPEGPPPDYTVTEVTVMSNFDHTIDHALAERLRQGKITMDYTGRDFCGEVWNQDEQFHCAVRVFGICKEIVTRPTLEQIMLAVSEEYGHE